MPDPETVTSLRAVRDSARARFNAGIEQVRTDIEVRGVGSRIAGKLESDAKAAGIYALDVVRDNKGIVGGTVAALGIWFFREPISDWIEEHFGEPDLLDKVKTVFEDAIK
jgi:hypothetical protein